MLLFVCVYRCTGNCNTPDDLSSRICVPNETEDLNFHVFCMITEINKSRMLAKHISCKCECKFDDRKYNLNQNGIMTSVGVSVKIQKNISVKKGIFGILEYVAAKMVNMQEVLVIQ